MRYIMISFRDIHPQANRTGQENQTQQIHELSLHPHSLSLSLSLSVCLSLCLSLSLSVHVRVCKVKEPANKIGAAGHWLEKEGC